jgi:ribose 5-phosphate isomerase
MSVFSRKESHKLGEKYKKGIPVEVIPMASYPVQQKIEEMYGGTAELRMGKMKAVCDLMFEFVIDVFVWTVSLGL